MQQSHICISICVYPGAINSSEKDMESIPNRSSPKSNPSNAPSNALLPDVTCVATDAAPDSCGDMTPPSLVAMGDELSLRCRPDRPVLPTGLMGPRPVLRWGREEGDSMLFITDVGAGAISGGNMLPDTGGICLGTLSERPSAMSFSRSTS